MSKKEIADFSKYSDEVLSEDIKVKRLIRRYKLVINDQRKIIKELINNPLFSILNWFNKRKEAK